MKSCYFCGGALERRRIEHMHEWAGKRYLIRNVGADVCRQCGEVFLAPATLRAIDRVVKERKPDAHVAIGVYELKTRAA